MSYPGVDRDLRWLPESQYLNGPHYYPIGAHCNCNRALSNMLPIREVFMMALMNALTDKLDWHKKVFDEQIVAKWRQEAREQPEDGLYMQILASQRGPFGSDVSAKPRERFLSERAFDYCIAELRTKAVYFDETGLVPVLDSDGHTVVKSNRTIPHNLHDALRNAFETLKSDQASQIDWHPRSNDMVQNLIHPSMYPFVYGRSRFVHDEIVGVKNALDMTGRGEIVPETQGSPPDRFGYGIGGSGVPPEYWSTKFQWLPANLEFRPDGGVRFTSYINNLHPQNYPAIYATIERLIDAVIPAWDQCLSECYDLDKFPVGRSNSRFSLPEQCDDEEDGIWEPLNPEALADVELSDDDIDDLKWDVSDEEKAKDKERHDDDPLKGVPRERIDEAKWEKIRDPIIPEPDGFEEIDYSCKKSIRDKFAESGLQVIVKMASIELTPEKPEFPMGGWHIEGQMNERIVATALYYLDSENVTPSHLSFRAMTSSYQDELQDKVGQDSYSFLEHIYGNALGSGPCLQYYGTVETNQGRLVAFPNIFQHRVSPFSLQDPSKCGHRRFIALWLVDPHHRIISTANVPPQQKDWWEDAVFGPASKSAHGEMPRDIAQLLNEKGISIPDGVVQEGGYKLPPEILDMVRQLDVLPASLMDREEAEKHRLELMDVRTRHDRDSEHFHLYRNTYSFCEH